MKKIGLLLGILLFTLSCISQDEIGRTFEKTIKFNDGMVVGPNGDFLEGITLSNGLVGVEIDGVEYQLRPVTTPVWVDSSAVLNATDDTVRIYYNKVVTGTIDTLDYDITVNGDYVSIGDPVIFSTQVRIPLDASIVTGEDVQVYYYQPSTDGLTDTYGSKANDTVVVVTNRVEEGTLDDATLLAGYDYEGDYNNFAGTYTMSASAGMALSTDRPQGAYSGNYDGSNNFTWTTSSMNLTTDGSWFGAVKMSGTEDYDNCLWELGGVKLLANMSTLKFELRTITGSDSASAYSTACITPGAWGSLKLTVDKTNGLTNGVHFRYNKVDVDSDSLIRNDFSVSDTLIVGTDAGMTDEANALIDFPRWYSGELTDAEGDDLHDALIWGTNPIDDEAPAPDTSNVGYFGDSIVGVWFDEPLFYPTTDLTSWDWLVGGVNTTIYSYEIDENVVKLTVPSLSGGETCRIRYDSSGVADLQDEAGNFVDTFNLEVNNLIVSDLTYIGAYFMEQNGDTEIGDNDATPSGAVYSSGIKTQGSYSLNGGNTSFMTTDANTQMATTSDSSFFVFTPIYYASSATNEYSDFIGSRHINDWGWEVGVDQVNDHITVQIENENDDIATFYSSTGLLGDSDWHTVGVQFKMASDSIYMWADGVLHSGHVMPWNFPTTGAVTIGRGKSTYNAYVDAVHLINGEPTATQIAALDADPGTLLSGGGGGPTPPTPPSEEFDIILEQDWDHWETDGTIPFEYEAYHPTLYPTGERHTNDDFGFASGVWRDGDVGWRNTVEGVNPILYNKTWRDSIVYHPITGSPAFCVSPREGDVNSYTGGEKFVMSFEKQREIFVTYDWTFRDGMLENKGGKIPALLGGGPYQCCDPPTTTQGFAAHIMFSNGNFNTYAYYYNQPNDSEYAAKQDWDQFQPVAPSGDSGDPFTYVNGALQINYDNGDRTYEVTLRIVMNTGTSANGFVEGFVNGYLVHRLTGIRWTYGGWPTDGIDQTNLSVFWGGATPNEACLQDEKMWIDNYWVWLPSDVTTQAGYTPLLPCDDATILVTPNDAE